MAKRKSRPSQAGRSELVIDSKLVEVRSLDPSDTKEAQ